MLYGVFGIVVVHPSVSL